MVVYQDDPRHPSMSSDSLKKRGHCCRSACLHCPYGFTVKRHSIKFLEFNETNIDLVQDLTGQLALSLDEKQFSEYRLVILKNFIIGYIKVNSIVVTEMNLLPSFRDQGLSKELIESYYFY